METGVILSEKEKAQQQTIAGILELFADLFRTNAIIVDPDSVQNDDGSFSFKYRKGKTIFS
jgi:hypothetical protein